jgi:hypothetical protein
MRLRPDRRAVLLLPLLLAACGGTLLLTGCGGEEETPAPETGGDFPPLRYGYLPPIKLNVQRMQTDKGFVPPTGVDEMIGFSPVDPLETLYAMARDRLRPVAQSGTATFRILTASITRHHDTLNGVLAVRLDVRDGDNTGYVVARVTANHSGEIKSMRAALYEMLKSLMSEMNVELEYQIRNKLKTWVVNAQAEPASQPQPASQAQPEPQAQPAPQPEAAPQPEPPPAAEPPPASAPEPPPDDAPPAAAPELPPAEDKAPPD